ncbi:MAG: tetratricopeptide repeat protein [Candidatus Omnitrophica bacterium]|nr:tetratricopeptide repeat protein [Candidatus Omnitrophota bacterium]
MTNQELSFKNILQHGGLLLALLVAVILRIAYAIDFWHSPFFPLMPYTDGYYYYTWANDIASGEFIKTTAFMKWPLYAYFFSLLIRFCSDPLTSLYIFQFAAGVLTCGLIYFISLKIFNRPTAVIAGLLCAVYTPFIFYEGLATYTSLSILLEAVFLLFVLNSRGSVAPNRFFSLGLIAGICFILQGNIIIFSLAALVWLLSTNASARPKFLSLAVCFFLGLGAVVSITAMMNFCAEKDAVAVTGNFGFNFYSGNNSQARGMATYDNDISRNQEDMLRDARIVAQSSLHKKLKTSEVSHFWFKKSTAFIKEHPGQYLHLLFQKALLIFCPENTQPEKEYSAAFKNIRLLPLFQPAAVIIFPLALFGFIFSLKHRRNAALLYCAILSCVQGMLLFFVIDKLRIHMMPFLIILAAYGIYSLFDIIRNKEYLKMGGMVILLIFCFILINQRSILPAQNNSRLLDRQNLYDQYLDQADSFESGGEILKAIQALKTASVIGPDNRRAPFRMGIILVSLGDLKGAEENFKRAITLSPTCVDALYNLGFIYNKQQKYLQALESLIRAADLNPDDARVHFELGIAYKESHDLKNAATEQELALKKMARWRVRERSLIIRELGVIKQIR